MELILSIWQWNYLLYVIIYYLLYMAFSIIIIILLIWFISNLASI